MSTETDLGGRVMHDQNPPVAIAQRPQAEYGDVVVAVISITVGLLLGIANQVAEGTPLALRLPAMLAALLMFGQGVVNLNKWNTDRKAATVVTLPEQSRSQDVELRVANPSAPTGPALRAQTVTAARKEVVPPAVPAGILFLSGWLGWSNLVTPDATPELRVLALVAAFLLALSGLSVAQKPK